MSDEKNLLREFKTYYCLDCGKCTSVCPVSKYDADFSPRRIVEKAVFEGWDELLADPITWECLTCNMCSLRCPADVRFINFIRRVRTEAVPLGNESRCTHGETIHAWIRDMAESDRKQDRLSILEDGLRYGQEGEYLYFMGCLPYYQAYFGDWGIHVDRIASSTIGILNSFGIEPAVMQDEVCCGHDLLWAGDTGTFEKLLEKNLEAIEKTGARTIVVSCSECLRTLSVDYREHAESFGLEVIHIAQFLEQRLDDVRERTAGRGRKPVRVTYHDPCRMSKHLGILDAPRAVLTGAEGVELVEMAHSRVRSLCCGTSLWISCGEVSKKIQLERLGEAADSGAEYLVSACPKCQIHLRCAQRDAGIPAYDRVPLIDFSSFMNSQLSGSDEANIRDREAEA
jgi:heterodisulfide reductase subunit D